MDNYIEEITNAGKTSYETLQKMSDINASTMQKLAELQFDFAAYSIETGLEQGKLISSTTSYQDFLTAGSDFAEAYSTKAMDFGKKAADIFSESQELLVELVEKEINKVSKPAKPAAAKPAAAKPAAAKNAT
ncbi:MAG TPA: phasin family protein, partial [Gammaproteobacteria bacterium]